ncbi:TPA: hypothetical protein RMT65_000193 [Escherichia coli]|uniref:hypothetical protein n=1 Tax=Klebsiella pneumoniae complex TaxID=3390273 RepID=UPI0006BE11B8|nr:hypothetical protein [Klebsiella quasivariicola]BAS34554.1 putative uncharacterized protein [Klebsiella pneumoniae]HDW4080543.1 hypothetical protein [Escherichia coli]
MTDITELAQSLKAAAIDAKELAIIARYSKGRAAAEKFYALANPNNVIALVEALEKVQSRDVTQAAKDYHFDQQADRIAELDAELEREREKTRRVMSRIAELESRTVKLPAERFCPAEYAGSQLWSETEVWNKAITACADALRADGIKVEAE